MYGANRSLLSLMFSLKDKGYQVHLISREDGLVVQKSKIYSIKTLVLKFHLSFYSIKRRLPFLSFLNYFKNIPPFFKLLNHIESIKPDIIYSNSSVMDIGFWAARVKKIPHIWHIRELGFEDYQVKPILGNSILKKLFSMSDRVIYISNYISDKYLIKEQNSVVVYNGICRKSEIKSKKVKKSSEKIIFSVVGVLSESKNQKTVILAFSIIKSHFPNCILHLYGDGELEYVTILKNICFDLGVEDSVFFMGFENDLDEIYLNTDCLLMPSLFEAFGRVVVEAMQYNIPVIVNGCGGLLEIVVKDENGLVYDSTIDGLVFEMKSFLTNEKLVNYILSNAHKTILEKFTIESYTENIENLILHI